MLIGTLNCEDCQQIFSLEDKLIKNKSNLEKEECRNYSISFIKKFLDNNFMLEIIINCKKCNQNIFQSFSDNEKEYHFKCPNCSLKGLYLYYCLSIEEDNSQDKIPEIKKEEDIASSKPINNGNSLNNKFLNNFDIITIPYNQNDELKKVIHPKSELNKNNKILSGVELPIKNIHSEANNKKIKRYVTPREKIKVIFIKNKYKYQFTFNESDIINDKIYEIKNSINLGSYPVFYFNGDIIDVNKTFKENQIFDGSIIEIED